MKKISNWLVGSFFRTIGRFLAIAGIGILFYIIASKSGLKLTHLLGIDTIYADTGTYSSSLWSLRTINPNLSDCTYTTDNLLLCAYRGYETNKNLGDYYFNTTYNDMSVLVTDARLYAYASSTDKFLSSRFYTFNYTICQSNHVSLSTLKSKTTVSQWGYNSSNAATGATMSNGSEVTLLISELEGTTTINNTTSYCYNYQFSVTPKIDSRFIGFYIHYGTTKADLVVADTVNRAGTLYSVQSLDVTYSTGTGAVIQDSANQIINNNNQNTQDIINNQINNTNTIINNQNENTEQIIDTLTDDTINNSDIENGLDLDYDTSQSYGAFSGFLLLPLTWVQQILSPQDSCSAINLPLPYLENKYLILPCMNDFWNGLGTLADLVSLVWIAVVGVRIFNGLYLLVVDVTSTEDNAEKLDKVRSWEL